MEPISITATELRTRSRELIERVHYYHECYQIKTFGRPMAVILSCAEFETLQALRANGSATAGARVTSRVRRAAKRGALPIK